MPTPDRNLALPSRAYFRQYDNGLKLLVFPDSGTKLAQMDVRHAVGFREDPVDQPGMAHFVEHMMFQLPSAGAGSPKIFSDLPQHSLFFNAYTSLDRTHYMHGGLAPEIETYMRYTASRIGFDCAGIDEASFLREREVVRNEHRWRSQDPEVTVQKLISDQIFPKGHPYHYDLANDEGLASIRQEDTCAFIRRHYGASTTNIVITGAVDPDRVLELGAKYLEPLPRSTPAPRRPVPPVTMGRTVTVRAAVKKPTAAIVFAMPRRFTPAYPAARAALETLFLSTGFFAMGEGTVIKELGLASFGGEELSLLGLTVETKKASELDRGVDAVLDAITRGFSLTLTGRENRAIYDGARQRSRLAILEALTPLFGRANALADYLEEGDRPRFYGGELQGFDDLTTPEIQRFGREAFSRQKALIVKVVPDGRKRSSLARADFTYRPAAEDHLSLPDQVDAAEAKRPLPYDDISVLPEDAMELELANGLKVLLVRSGPMPVLEAQLIVNAGYVDTPNASVIADMAARGFGVDYARQSSSELAKGFEFSGGQSQAYVGPFGSTFVADGLAIYADFLFAHMSEQVIHGEYRTGALESWKERRRRELDKKSRRQVLERDNAYYTALFGEGHPSVRPEATDRSKINAVSLRDVEAFRKAHYRANKATFVVTGNFDPELAMAYIASMFGEPKLRFGKKHWSEPSAAVVRAPLPEPKLAGPRTLTQIDPERAQTELHLAFPLREVYGPDHAALLVLASMLDFQMRRVREVLGASYGVYAKLDESRPRIEIGGPLDSSRASEAFEAIWQAVREVRDGVDFDRRFVMARRQALKRFLEASGDPQLLAGAIANTIRAGRPYAYYAELGQAIASLTPEQVATVAKAVLPEKRAVALAIGPKAGIASILRSAYTARPIQTLPEVVHADDEE